MNPSPLTWSYAPYRPPMYPYGDIAVCRIAPDETSVRIEWLPVGEPCRVRFSTRFGAPESRLIAVREGITENACTISDLPTDTDFEFTVEGMVSGKKSRTRLVRTGKIFGSVVNYLHPDDDIYAFAGKYLCSPSFVRHPDGHLLASMDLFAPAAPQNLTLIFRSDDDGKTWRYVTDLYPAFWGKLFIHKGDVYMLANSTEYGDLLIGKSTDGGNTFCTPTVLMRGSCSPKHPGVHRNPQPVVRYKGRIWNTLEWGAWAAGFHAPMIMSADENADLLDARSWTITDPLPYDPKWQGVAKGPSTGVIEGTLAIAPDGTMYNIMRYDTAKTTPSYGLALAFKVNTDDPSAPLTYSHAVPLNGNLSKFMIKKDPKTGLYYTLLTRITDPRYLSDRRLLSLMKSEDLLHWELVKDILDRRDASPKEVGFQYVDFEIEGDDILYFCRTAMNKAHNFHDANYEIFDRIEDFRNL